jgi:hypothetical protein
MMSARRRPSSALFDFGHGLIFLFRVALDSQRTKSLHIFHRRITPRVLLF